MKWVVRKHNARFPKREFYLCYKVNLLLGEKIWEFHGRSKPYLFDSPEEAASKMKETVLNGTYDDDNAVIGPYSIVYKDWPDLSFEVIPVDSTTKVVSKGGKPNSQKLA